MVDLKDIMPLQGELFPIKTVQQTQSQESTGEAYVAEINIKAANSVLKVLDSTFPRDPTLITSHLRRFAKPGQLPNHIKPKDPKRQENEETSRPQTIYVLITPPLPDISMIQDLLSPYAPVSPADEQGSAAVNVKSTRILLQPPTSAERAEFWSKEFWPTTYNASSHPAAHSPPPGTLASMKKLLDPEAGKYLALARKVAEEATELKRGRPVGAVAVDPALASAGGNSNDEDGLRAVVAVAGDARYRDYTTRSSKSESDLDQESGPETHALMRLIAIIANKSVSETRQNESSTKRVTAHARPLSLSPLESSFHRALPSHDISPTELKDVQPNPLSESMELVSDNLLGPDPGSSTGPYLCTSLDIYITHDPCPCCAMGMVLSRFRAVVYIRDESRIGLGGLASTGPADSSGPVAGYGLHWRRELNWRSLGFEFVEKREDVEKSGKKPEEQFNA
ncbi:tRNA-specific adenosine deaminase subunit tad3 [Arachnomyces sp. PD_36]|nr:tRNA-specific adenosine deaminase subunit tad3 [Arachnomyces sp. PD_36]